MKKTFTFKNTIAVCLFLTTLFFSSNAYSQDEIEYFPPKPNDCRFLEQGKKIFIGSFLKQTKRPNSKNEETDYAKFLIDESLIGMERKQKSIELANLAYNTSEYFHKFLVKDKSYLVFSWMDKKIDEFELSLPIPVIRVPNKKKNQGFQLFFGDFRTDSDNLKDWVIIEIIHKKKKLLLDRFDSSGGFAIVYPKDENITVTLKINEKVKPQEEFETYSKQKFSNIYYKNGKTILNFPLLKDKPCSEKLLQFESTN